MHFRECPCADSSSSADLAGSVPRVGLYREHVVPRLVDLACGSAGFDRWRARATEGLAGRVVEIGFGSGHNVPHYPPDVDVVLAVEPAPWPGDWPSVALRPRRCPSRTSASTGSRSRSVTPRATPRSCTFTLCTVPDPQQALSELRRVVRPGGTLHFFEHGLSPETRRRHVAATSGAAGNAGSPEGATSPGIRLRWSNGPGSSWSRTSSVTCAARSPGAWLTLGVAARPMR